jgi:hypothetical protein
LIFLSHLYGLVPSVRRTGVRGNERRQVRRRHCLQVRAILWSPSLPAD